MKTPEMLLIIGTMLFIQFLNWLIFRKKKEQIELQQEVIESQREYIQSQDGDINLLQAKLDEVREVLTRIAKITQYENMGKETLSVTLEINRTVFVEATDKTKFIDMICVQFKSK